MAAQSNDFTYFFGEKDDLLLVLFQGKILSKDVPALEECETRILEKPQKIVLFFFRDVSVFFPGTHPTFTKMQKSIREKGKLIGICSLKPDIKAVLLQAGIIRESEIFNNIPSAWQKLSGHE